MRNGYWLEINDDDDDGVKWAKQKAAQEKTVWVENANKWFDVVWQGIGKVMGKPYKVALINYVPEVPKMIFCDDQGNWMLPTNMTDIKEFGGKPIQDPDIALLVLLGVPDKYVFTYNDEWDEKHKPISDIQRAEIIAISDCLGLGQGSEWFYFATIHGAIFMHDDSREDSRRFTADDMKAIASIRGLRWFESNKHQITIGLGHNIDIS